jgi:gliding motility-associated-like protein
MKVKIWIGFLMCFLAIASVVAQSPYPSRDGNFTVDEIRGCAPLTINLSVPLTVCDPLNNKPCDFFYEGQPFQNVFKWTFNTPGVYEVIGIFQSGVPSDRITITVLPNTPPAFEVYSCGSNGIQVKVNDTNYERYVIDFNDPSVLYDTIEIDPPAVTTANHFYPSSAPQFVTVRGRNLGADDNCSKVTQSITTIPLLVPPTINQLQVSNTSDIQLDFNNNGQPNVRFRLEIAVNNSTNFQFHSFVFGTSSVTVNNLRTDDNYYCFRLTAFDPCNNLNYYSNIICSSNFDVTAQNNNNRLTWVTSSVGVIDYSITKNPGTPLNAASTTTFLNDPNTICGTEYCYQLTANYSGAQSISLQKCTTAISTDIPTVVENISTIVGTNSTVELRWTQDPAFNVTAYLVTKAVNGTFAERDTVTTPTFTDDAYASDATSCYTINYDDACANKSPVSVEVCPIILVGSLQEDNAISLSWNAYNGWRNGVDHYIVEKFSDQGQLLRTFNAGVNTTYVDNTQDLLNQVALYRITAVANDGGIVSSVSNTITIIKDPNLFYPTAFTPNADRLNDIFNVFGQYITNFEMRIFNRWGEMMYSTEDIDQGWNGFYKGTLMPEGTYVFRATITDQAGRTFDRSGTVLLLRKN